MVNCKDIRIAFLLPSLELGAYWQPVLNSLRNIYNHTIIYTACLWPGFDSKSTGTDAIKLVGKIGLIQTQKASIGYNRGFILLSPKIVIYLIRFKPDVIFASSYSMWTLLAIIFKPLFKWKIIIAYEGSAPNVDQRDSKFRTFYRKKVSLFADAFLTNSKAGKNYLVDFLSIDINKVYAQPYMVSDSPSLQQKTLNFDLEISNNNQNIVFLYVGRLEKRKGINLLLKACTLLQQQGYQNYKLQIIGTGVQQDELQAFVEEQCLTECVEWLGWVDYGYLGEYFSYADVFVFPTLEDTWGMVLLEAMAFGKPVLSSKWAGSSEIVINGKNGYVFDPYQPEQLAQMMRYFIDCPQVIESMGKNSLAIISENNPETAADLFARLACKVLA